jgi:hypothetical protein
MPTTPAAANVGASKDVSPQGDSPLAVHMASAPLPASGDFTTNTATALAPGSKRVSFWLTYTRGGASGQMKFRVEWTDEDGNAATEPVNDATALTAAEPYGRMKHYLGEFLGPVAQDANPLRWPVSFEVPAGAKLVAVQLAEVGAVGTPGTAQVEYSCSGQL